MIWSKRHSLYKNLLYISNLTTFLFFFEDSRRRARGQSSQPIKGSATSSQKEAESNEDRASPPFCYHWNGLSFDESEFFLGFALSVPLGLLVSICLEVIPRRYARKDRLFFFFFSFFLFFLFMRFADNLNRCIAVHRNGMLAVLYQLCRLRYIAGSRGAEASLFYFNSSWKKP